MQNGEKAGKKVTKAAFLQIAPIQEQRQSVTKKLQMIVTL